MKMNLETSPDVIVFDLYNTLIKVNRRSLFFKDLYQRSNYLLSNYTIKEFQKMLMTKNLDYFIASLPSSIQDSYQNNCNKLDEELESVCLFDGVKELLTELKKSYKLGLISNLATPYKSPFYDLGLSKFFEEVVFSCDVGCQKPNKEIFKIMEKRVGVEKSKILMIGDSLKSDYFGSKSVGWDALQVVRKKTNSSVNQISSITQLMDYLNK